MLQRSGKGPNCETCHGSMATTVLTYGNLDETCSLCHGKPEQAAKALSLIRSAKNLYDRLSPKKQEPFKARLKKIKMEWHSFDVVSVIEASEKLIKEMKGELR